MHIFSQFYNVLHSNELEKPGDIPTRRDIAPRDEKRRQAAALQNARGIGAKYPGQLSCLLCKPCSLLNSAFFIFHFSFCLQPSAFSLQPFFEA